MNPLPSHRSKVLSRNLLSIQASSQSFFDILNSQSSPMRALGLFWEHMPAIDPSIIRDRMLSLQNLIRSLENRTRALLEEQRELIVRVVHRGD